MVATDFENLTSPDHELWRSHRALIKHIPRKYVGYRGCLGLGMGVNTAEIEQYDDQRIFAKDADVTWYVMQDIPYGKWSTALNREVHLGSVRKTGFRYGMPFIGALQKQFDFRRCPYDQVVRDDIVRPSDAECLKPSVDEAAFKAFNAIEWAMTSTAFFFRGTWAPKVKHYYETLGLEQSKRRQLLFGQEIFDSVAPSRNWMPEPYLAFRVRDARDIFERATTKSLLTGKRTYTLSFKQAFIADCEARLPITAPIGGKVIDIHKGLKFDALGGCKTVVILDPESKARCEQPVLPGFVPKIKIGDTVAKGECLGWDGPQLPEEFGRMTVFKQWLQCLPQLFGGAAAFDSVLKMWFERQHVRLKKGFIHLPASIAAPAALTLAVNEELWWNIAPAMPYYNEPLDTFVFPTLRQGAWNEHRMDLTPEVELDVRLTHDHRFLDWPEDFVASPFLSRRTRVETQPRRETKPEVKTPAPQIVFIEEPATVVEQPVAKTPVAAPVTPAPQRVNKKEFRQNHKDSTKGRPNAKKHRLHQEPTRTAFDTVELNRVRTVLELPLVDTTVADSQPKADALAFEQKDARAYRRPYLPKTYEKVDLAKLTDEEWELMVAARAAMKAQGVAT